MDIHAPRPEDAAAFLAMMTALDSETPFMLYEPGERPQDVSRVADMLRRHAAQGSLMLCAWDGDEPVGFLSAERGGLARIAHSAYIVCGIREKWRGQGIGTALFVQLEEWAVRQAVTRLELTVVCDNARALHLYEKRGFTVEGRKRAALCHQGRYADEFLMAKLLGDAAP